MSNAKLSTKILFVAVLLSVVSILPTQAAPELILSSLSAKEKVLTTAIGLGALSVYFCAAYVIDRMYRLMADEQVRDITKVERQNRRQNP
jgi:hypothetical protein